MINEEGIIIKFMDGERVLIEIDKSIEGNDVDKDGSIVKRRINWR